MTELKRRSPLLFEVLQAVACNIHQKQLHKAQERHYSCIGLAGCALLFNSNPKMCRLQMAVGMVLEKGGTTDEVQGTCIIDIQVKLQCITSQLVSLRQFE